MHERLPSASADATSGGRAAKDGKWPLRLAGWAGGLGIPAGLGVSTARALQSPLLGIVAANIFFATGVAIIYAINDPARRSSRYY